MRGAVAFIVCLAFWGSRLLGQSATVRPSIIWQKGGAGPVLAIRLADYLSAQQKELINSGFSTFSQVSIYDDGPQSSGIGKRSGKRPPPRLLWQLSCSVKFDTWEERYEVVRLEKEARPEQARDFAAYSELCLGFLLEGGEDFQRLQREGGKLRALLALDQIAAEQAAQIKEWLVKQQSGIIQGLFSHMLGDFKLSEKVELTLHVPPAARFSAVHPYQLGGGTVIAGLRARRAK